MHCDVVDASNARCNYCRLNLSYKGGSTSNLRKHLAAKHPLIKIGDDKAQKRLKTVHESESDQQSDPLDTEDEDLLMVTGTELKAKTRRRLERSGSLDAYFMPKVTLPQKKNFHRLVLKMVIKDLQPFKIVEDEGFRALVGAFQPLYDLPSRSTLSREMLPPMYSETAEIVKKVLATAEFVTLTTDC